MNDRMYLQCRIPLSCTTGIFMMYLTQSLIFEVKTFLATFWQGKILWVGVINVLVVRASNRIKDLICFQEALIRFSKLGFPVAHGEFLRLKFEDYI